MSLWHTLYAAGQISLQASQGSPACYRDGSGVQPRNQLLPLLEPAWLQDPCAQGRKEQISLPLGEGF